MAARDIRIAQAASLMMLGDEWMGRPATPSPRVKYSHACRLYEAAADIYRTFGRWRLAGEAYQKCGEAERMQQELLMASTYFSDAGECLERVDAGEAILMYNRAVGLFATLGRFVSAASLQTRTAELYVADGAMTQAAEAYQYASEYFLGEEQFSQAVQALYESGSCLAKEEAFELAADKFDRASRFAMDDNLLKLKVPELMFDACLCSIAAGDLGRAEALIMDCSQRDPNFAVGREKRFLLDVVDSARGASLNEFADHCWNYDFVDALDPFELALLQVVSERIVDGPVAVAAEDSDEEEEEAEEEEEEEEAEADE